MVPNFALFYEIKIFSQRVFALTQKTVFLKNTKVSEGNFALTHKSEKIEKVNPHLTDEEKYSFFIKKREIPQTPTGDRDHRLTATKYGSTVQRAVEDYGLGVVRRNGLQRFRLLPVLFHLPLLNIFKFIRSKWYASTVDLLFSCNFV